MTLVALAYQWPEERTLELAKRIANGGKAGTLTERARRTVERLQQHLQSTVHKPTANTNVVSRP